MLVFGVVLAIGSLLGWGISKLQANLRSQGYAAFLSQVTADGKLQFRVRIGPQKDRAGAETTAAQLLKANHRGQVVPHP